MLFVSHLFALSLTIYNTVHWDKIKEEITLTWYQCIDYTEYIIIREKNYTVSLSHWLNKMVFWGTALIKWNLQRELHIFGTHRTKFPLCVPWVWNVSAQQIKWIPRHWMPSNPTCELPKPTLPWEHPLKYTLPGSVKKEIVPPKFKTSTGVLCPENLTSHSPSLHSPKLIPPACEQPLWCLHMYRLAHVTIPLLYFYISYNVQFRTHLLFKASRILQPSAEPTTPFYF